jgi:hypothetical protein
MFLFEMESQRDSTLLTRHHAQPSGDGKRIILESAVEHGFVGNPGVPGKASFAVNGYSLNKNDNAAGCVGIFHKFL